jgi:hypothetical protein
MSRIVRLNGDTSAMSVLVQENCRKLSRTPFQPPSVEFSLKKQRTIRQVEHGMHDSPQKENSDYHQPQPPPPVYTARRVTNALTAREIYESALDPALVPKPLTFRGQLRNVSAPAALETADLPTTTFEPHQAGATENTSSISHFRGRPRSHQHALLDVSARLIAVGFEAADIAQLMDLTLQELVHELARFTIAARDTPSIVEEEIRLFCVSVPASSDRGASRSRERDPNVTGADITHTLGGQLHGEEALAGHEPHAAEEGPWISIEEVSTAQDLEKDEAQQDDDEASVYHDALESLKNEPKAHKPMPNQEEHHATTYYRRPARIRRHNVLTVIPVPAPQANVNTTLWASSQHTQSLRAPVFRICISTTIWFSLAIFIGRLLGILLSELQTLLSNRGYSFLNILNILSVWAERIALVLAVVLLIQHCTRNHW